jgi:hypothetical protein
MRLRRKTEDRKGSAFSEGTKPMLSAVTAAGLMLLPGCGPQMASEMPATVPVRAHLGEIPANLAERLNEPGTGAQLTGRLADCKGMAGCQLPLTTGQLFMNVKFMPEEDGNLEVTVSEVKETGVVFQKRVDVNLGSPSYEYQFFEFGKAGVLFNTDLRMRVEKSTLGMPFAVIE